RSLDGRPGRMHILIARADAELTAGCWADADPRFAQIHVTMTKEDVRRGLEQLRELAPRLRSLPLTPASAADRAEFRRRARALIESVRPLCPLASGVSNDQVFAPARERVIRFASGLIGSDLAVHFNVAESDIEFEQSTAVVECTEPEALDLNIA